MKVIPLAMEGVRFYVNAMDIGTEVGEDGSHRYLGQICSLNLRISQSLANTKPDLFFLGGGDYRDSMGLYEVQAHPKVFINS